jgi:hypothetical protein
VYADIHIKRLDPSNSRYWLQVWLYSDKKEVDVTKATETFCKLKKKLNIFL